MSRLRYIAVGEVHRPCPDCEGDRFIEYNAAGEEAACGLCEATGLGEPLGVFTPVRSSALGHLFESPETARDFSPKKRASKVLELHLDELRDVANDKHADFERAERLSQHYTAAAEQLAIELGLRPPTLDKTDRDYHARVARHQELQRRLGLEVRRMCELFKPPGYVIETKPNIPHNTTPAGSFASSHGIEFDTLCASPSSWTACLRDDRPEDERSDAHVFVIARTEAGCYAKLLQIFIDGGGFFPMT